MLSTVAMFYKCIDVHCDSADSGAVATCSTGLLAPPAIA
jgi:hypothetical protein